MAAFSSGSNLSVGETAVVVDRDVHVLPADRAANDAVAVDAPWVGMLADPAADALAGAALDPSELLDVDVDELARPRALIPARLLEPEPAEPADTLPLQDGRDSRERHRKRLSDLGRGHPQPP